MKCGQRWHVSLSDRSFKRQHADHTFSLVIAIATVTSSAPRACFISLNPKVWFPRSKATDMLWMSSKLLLLKANEISVVVTAVLPNLSWQIQRILWGPREHDKLVFGKDEQLLFRKPNRLLKRNKSRFWKTNQAFITLSQVIEQWWTQRYKM